MENLEHWDYAESFSVYEAAYLVRGIDPSTIDSNYDYRAKPIIDRMTKSYESAQQHYSWGVGGYAFPDDELCARKIELVSIDMHSVLMARRALKIDDGFPAHPLIMADRALKKYDDMKDWNQSDDGSIELQQFSRAELHRWLSENNLPSKYNFFRLINIDAASTENQLSTTEHASQLPLSAIDEQRAFPWGNHSTILLTHMANAATKFWSRYDPSDPTTAPTNEDIENWLIKQKVSKRIAKAMATILRLDGFPTGRRE